MRNIKVLTSASTNIVRFQTSATTYGELKIELIENGVNLENAVVTDRHTKNIYRFDDALLPPGDVTLLITTEKMKLGGIEDAYTDMPESELRAEYENLSGKKCTPSDNPASLRFKIRQLVKKGVTRREASEVVFVKDKEESLHTLIRGVREEVASLKDNNEVVAAINSLSSKVEDLLRQQLTIVETINASVVEHKCLECPPCEVCTQEDEDDKDALALLEEQLSSRVSDSSVDTEDEDDDYEDDYEEEDDNY